MSPQCERVRDFILSNPGCTSMDIIRGAKVCKYTNRITELRREGYTVECVEDNKNGIRLAHYWITDRQLFSLSAPKKETLDNPARKR